MVSTKKKSNMNTLWFTLFFLVGVRTVFAEGTSDDSSDKIRQEYFDHYECTLQCYKDAFELDYIYGDLCKGTVALDTKIKEAVPFERIVKSIECITVKCKSTVPPCVCENGYIALSSDKPFNQNSDKSFISKNNPSESNGNIDVLSKFFGQNYDAFSIDNDKGSSADIKGVTEMSLNGQDNPDVMNREMPVKATEDATFTSSTDEINDKQDNPDNPDVMNVKMPIKATEDATFTSPIDEINDKQDNPDNPDVVNVKMPIKATEDATFTSPIDEITDKQDNSDMTNGKLLIKPIESPPFTSSSDGQDKSDAVIGKLPFKENESATFASQTDEITEGGILIKENVPDATFTSPADKGQDNSKKKLSDKSIEGTALTSTPGGTNDGKDNSDVENGKLLDAIPTTTEETNNYPVIESATSGDYLIVKSYAGPTVDYSATQNAKTKITENDSKDDITKEGSSEEYLIIKSTTNNPTIDVYSTDKVNDNYTVTENTANKTPPNPSVTENTADKTPPNLSVTESASRITDAYSTTENITDFGFAVSPQERPFKDTRYSDFSDFENKNDNSGIQFLRNTNNEGRNFKHGIDKFDSPETSYFDSSTQSFTDPFIDYDPENLYSLLDMTELFDNDQQTEQRLADFGYKYSNLNIQPQRSGVWPMNPIPNNQFTFPETPNVMPHPRNGAYSTSIIDSTTTESADKADSTNMPLRGGSETALSRNKGQLNWPLLTNQQDLLSNQRLLSNQPSGDQIPNWNELMESLRNLQSPISDPVVSSNQGLRNRASAEENQPSYQSSYPLSRNVPLAMTSQASNENRGVANWQSLSRSFPWNQRLRNIQLAESPNVSTLELPGNRQPVLGDRILPLNERLDNRQLKDYGSSLGNRGTVNWADAEIDRTVSSYQKKGDVQSPMLTGQIAF